LPHSREVIQGVLSVPLFNLLTPRRSLIQTQS
jgi:hypothetical protein